MTDLCPRSEPWSLHELGGCFFCRRLRVERMSQMPMIPVVREEEGRSPADAGSRATRELRSLPEPASQSRPSVTPANARGAVT